MPARLPSPEAFRPARGGLLALVVVLALLLSGCGGASKEEHPKSAPQPKGSSTSSSSGSGSDEPAPDPAYGAPKVGDCHQLGAARSVASVDPSAPVSCKRAHTSVVVHVGYQPKPVTPSTPVAERRRLGRKLCQPAYQRTAGGTLADRATSILT